MADVVTRLVVESKEYDSKIARATSGLTQFEKKCREVGGTLEFVEKEDLDFVKALGQMETVSSSAVGSLSELKKAFTELSVQYKNLTDAEKKSPYGQALAGSLGQLKGRIGELGGQLSSAQGELTMSGTAFEKFAGKMGLSKEALGQVGQAMGQLGPVASGLGRVMTGALGPVGIAIAAVVLAIKQLVDAFKRNEDAMEAVNKIAAPFKAVWQTIQRLFDDIVRVFVDVYNSLDKATGKFSIFKVALSPITALITKTRVQAAVLGTILRDLAAGIAFVGDKIRGAFRGSVVGDFFRNMTETIEGFFGKLTKWMEKIANSKLGKKLGLDKLAIQLREIVNAQDKLTASNKQIAESENELNKLKRSSNEANAKNDLKIAKLREEASEKDKYNAAERVKMLEEAARLEEENLQRTLEIKRKELELIKLKNSLTQSGTADLDAQSAAEVAVLQAETEYYNRKRALQRQIQSARNEDEKANGGGTTDTETAPVDGSIAAQEEKIKKLTELWKNATDELRDGYKKELEEAQAVLDQMMGKTAAAAAPKPVKDAAAMWGEYSEKLNETKARLEEFKAMVTDQSLTNAQRDWAKGMAESYQEELNKMLGITEETTASISDMWKETLSNMSTGVDSISTIGNAFNDLKGIGEDLASVFSGEKDVWESLMTVFNSGISIMQTVIGVMEAINTLTELSTVLKQANTVATETEAATSVTAAATEAGAETVKAGANMATAGTAAAASSAEAGEAVAGIPIVGPILAVAAIAAVLAATFAAMSKAKSAGKFASGGVVGGNSYSGDKLMAYVNSGETILTPQQADRAVAGIQGNPMSNLKLSTEVSGTNLRIVLNNDNRAKGGGRTFYSEIHH